MDKDRFAENDAFAKFIGIELVDVAPGSATATLTLEQHHLNGHAVAHGGVTATLADFAFAAAANAHGNVALAININVSYVKAARQGTVLTARAVEQSINPKIATSLVRVTDDEGDLVATFQGMAYRKKDPVHS